MTLEGLPKMWLIQQLLNEAEHSKIINPSFYWCTVVYKQEADDFEAWIVFNNCFIICSKMRESWVHVNLLKSPSTEIYDLRRECSIIYLKIDIMAHGRSFYSRPLIFSTCSLPSIDAKKGAKSTLPRQFSSVSCLLMNSQQASRTFWACNKLAVDNRSWTFLGVMSIFEV